MISSCSRPGGGSSATGARVWVGPSGLPQRRPAASVVRVVRVIVGREAEQDRIDRLLADARSGSSGALVVAGEAGIGKTALLERAVSAAEGMRVVRGLGVDTEAELPFGGLHQLLHPFVDRLDALPGPQATALRAAFGLSDAAVENRFLVGAATLTLLADLAVEKPLLCAVDDAQWLDQASLDALLFAARRLHADPVAMIFAERETGQPFRVPGVEVLRLAGLPPDAAAVLLDESAPALTAPVRARVLEESGGNPLGLVELAAAFEAAERSGGSDLARQVGPLQVTGRVQEAFRSQIAGLPDATRLLLVVAAADGTAGVGGGSEWALPRRHGCPTCLSSRLGNALSCQARSVTASTGGGDGRPPSGRTATSGTELVTAA